MSKYERVVVPKFEKIKELRRGGQTEANIAKYLGLAYNTFRLYKKQHVELQELMDNAKEVLIKELEHTMFQMALGKIKVTDVKKYISQSGDKENVRLEETVRELPPSVPLLIFSLKNLCPSKWAEVQDLSANIHVDKAIKNINSVFDQMKEKLDGTEIDSE